MNQRISALSIAVGVALAIVLGGGAARAEDDFFGKAGRSISGAFTDAYVGLRDGILGAYDTSTKGAVEKWNDVTGKTGSDKAGSDKAGSDQAGSAAQDAAAAQVQRDLIAAGYNPGPVDGRYGPMTGNAIRAYQFDNGLPSDGQISPALLHHLQMKRTAAAADYLTSTTTTQAMPALPAPAGLPPQPPVN